MNIFSLAVEQLKTTDDKLQKILAAARPHSKAQLAVDTPFSSTGSLYSAPYSNGDRSEPTGQLENVRFCGWDLRLIHSLPAAA